MFLKNPALQEFCQQHNGQTLSQIHESFVNMDRFSAIIHKQRLLMYPEGRDFNGVLYEYHQSRNTHVRSRFKEVIRN